MRRGEIWWADLDAPSGTEPGGRRPVLVIQSDPYNSSALPTVIVAVVTSNIALADAPGNVLIAPRQSHLPKPSVVNVSQVLTMNRARLTERVGNLAATSMQRVDDGLRQILAV